MVNGQYITVLAGSLEDSPEQGIIYVVMTDPAQKTGTFEEFPSPQKAGSLRITKAENTRLIIQASNGAIFYFDVPGRQFAASMKVAIATITPLPPRPENTTLTEAPYPAPEKGEAPPYPSP